MIRKDFISKYVEELGKSLTRLIDYETNIEDENFLFHFNEMLRSYYRIHDEELEQLLVEDVERDQFLLSDELKKRNIRTYLKATSIYWQMGKKQQAQLCFQIVERIQNVNTGIFQFPTEEDHLITKEFNQVSELFRN